MTHFERRTAALLFILVTPGCGSRPGGGTPDGGLTDIGTMDGIQVDATGTDAGAVDAARPDLGPTDGGSTDAAALDAARPDAGTFDGGCASCTTSSTVAIHTITWAMAGGTVDLPDVAVRAASSAGAAPIEMSTDSTGHLTLDLPPGGAPWSITMAKRGYAASSVLDVTHIVGVGGFDGDVRLDPIGLPTYAVIHSGGTVSGVTAGNRAQVDNYDFGTDIISGGAWTAPYYLAPAPNPVPPLQFVAVELDSIGSAMNFVAAPEQPRTGTAAFGVDMTLPSPVAPVTTTTVRVHTPATGLTDVTRFGATPFAAMHALFELAQNPFVLTGSNLFGHGMPPYDVDMSIRHFGGPLDVNYTGVTLPGATVRINVVITDITDHEITVPPLERLDLTGTTIGDFVATGGGAGYDVLIVHLGETTSEDPHWRIFTEASAGTATVHGAPALPSSVTLDDIGISGALTSAIPLYVRMQHGRAWSTQGMNQAVPQYAWAGGGQYSMLSTSGTSPPVDAGVDPCAGVVCPATGELCIGGTCLCPTGSVVCPSPARCVDYSTLDAGACP